MPLHQTVVNKIRILRLTVLDSDWLTLDCSTKVSKDLRRVTKISRQVHFFAPLFCESLEITCLKIYVCVYTREYKNQPWDTETLTSQASWLFKIRALNEILEWSNLIKKLAAVWAKLSYDALRGLGKVNFILPGWPNQP